MNPEFKNFAKTLLSSKKLAGTTALNALKAIPGPISNFIAASTAAGYGADMILRTLRSLNKPKDDSLERERLQERASKGVATPEEERRLSEKQPSELGQTARGALQLVGGLGTAALAKSKPGGFLGEVAGQLMGEGEEVSGTGNPIRDLDPALADSVEQALQQQGNPLAAGQLVKIMGKFNNSISQLEKSLGQLFPDIVASVYGQEEAIAQESPTPTQDGEGQKLTAQDMIEAARGAREGMREGMEFLKSMFNR